MKNQTVLSKDQASKLEELLDYVFKNEAKNFERFCDDGGKKENHIYFTAVEISRLLGNLEPIQQCDL